MGFASVSSMRLAVLGPVAFLKEWDVQNFRGPGFIAGVFGTAKGFQSGAEMPQWGARRG